MEGRIVNPVLLTNVVDIYNKNYCFFYFSLAVRDISNLVKPEDIIQSENLMTILAIVPKYSQKDWLSSYETLSSYVVRTVIALRSNSFQSKLD